MQQSIHNHLMQLLRADGFSVRAFRGDRFLINFILLHTLDGISQLDEEGRMQSFNVNHRWASHRSENNSQNEAVLQPRRSGRGTKREQMIDGVRTGKEGPERKKWRDLQKHILNFKIY